MKDNLSLIAAAAGGFMLAVAASGIIKSAPVTFLNSPPTLNSTQATNAQTSALSASTASFAGGGSFAGGKSTPQTRSLRFKQRS